MMMMRAPKLLVIGGSGYLGRRIVLQAREGWDVVATFHSQQVSDPGAAWREMDIRQEGRVIALADQVRPTVIVNAAASNPGANDDFAKVNVHGAVRVARAAAAVGARLIHMSSDAIFDGEKGGYVEDDLPNPLTPYARSKTQAEEEVVASGARAVILRTSLVYGWHPFIDRHTRWVVDDLAAGKPVHLYTDELRCPIWVESLAAAVLELADAEYTGVLHVAGDQSVSRYYFGVSLLRFHGMDYEGIVPASIRKRGLARPLDGTLDCSRARAFLSTPLPGLDEVLGQHEPNENGQVCNQGG
jgi:dTDP-4-dehydrorhamnose reductase